MVPLTEIEVNTHVGTDSPTFAFEVHISVRCGDATECESPGEFLVQLKSRTVDVQTEPDRHIIVDFQTQSGRKRESLEVRVVGTCIFEKAFTLPVDGNAERCGHAQTRSQRIINWMNEIGTAEVFPGNEHGLLHTQSIREIRFPVPRLVGENKRSVVNISKSRRVRSRHRWIVENSQATADHSHRFCGVGKCAQTFGGIARNCCGNEYKECGPFHIEIIRLTFFKRLIHKNSRVFDKSAP